MSSATDAGSGAAVRLWMSLTFADADEMADWLRAVGFVERVTYRDEHDPAIVVHAEWVWSEGGGGVMFGSDRPGAQGASRPGAGAAYLVVADPDAVFERAVHAGAVVRRAMVDEDYGGRGGTVADPEGNLWSFGSYQPS